MTALRNTPPQPQAMCECEKRPATTPHTCPFREEINGDSTTTCTCCDDCTYQCAMDI